MKSITIHGLEDNVYILVKKKAELLGLSLNKTLKALLTEALGIQKKTINHKADFKEFCGCWSKDEEQLFLNSIKDFEKIDEEDMPQK